MEYDLLVSACEVISGKVFWTITRSYEKRPFSFGEVGSWAEAEEEILQALNNQRALLLNSNHALEEYIEQKMAAAVDDSGQSTIQDAARMEFVHEKYGHAKYQVKSKSASQMEVYNVRYFEGFHPEASTPTFSLNKRELDNKGETKARGQIFCTEEKKNAIERYRKIPRFLSIFGLDWNADVSEIKYSFRKLSMQHHPDRGGDEELFKELIASYEKAVKAILAKDIRDGFNVE